MKRWIAKCEVCGRTIVVGGASVPFDLTIGSHGALARDGKTVLLTRCPGSHQLAHWSEEQPAPSC